jgi:aryl-alcohol dehydrogenase-like predicted oxidoreductase
VERFLSPVCEELGIGLTTWSPLAFGVLTGKYLDGVPASSRARVQGVEWLEAMSQDAASTTMATEVVRLAGEVGCTPAQLAIAWCLRNALVSSVITGASTVAQVKENLGAQELAAKLDPEVVAQLERTAASLRA